MLVLRWNIIGFGADPKGTFGAPKGTVPFGKDLVRTVICDSIGVLHWLIECLHHFMVNEAADPYAKTPQQTH